MKDDRAIRQKKQRAYAESILYDAILIGGIDEALKVRNDLKNILYASMSNANLADIFSNELEEFSKENQKKVDIDKIIREIFAGASEAVLDTLSVMAQYEDLYLCRNINDMYNELLQEHFHVVVVDVITAVELDDHLRTLIKKKAQNDLDANVVLHEHIDKRILGGIILSAEHRIIDCSLKTIFSRTKTELTSVHHYGE